MAKFEYHQNCLTRMSHKFEKRCEARQSEIRAGSVLAHVTKRIAAITPPRALVVLRFLLNSTKETDCFWPNPTTLCYLTNYIRSAETGEIFGLILCHSTEEIRGKFRDINHREGRKLACERSRWLM